ncbi:hypothetical protein [Sphingobacterium sp. FBM7-1]|uniref:hypothetical protein n=1 Tax=Sphingobacterium sp. FBM7-1 TaxID=2886688 RepID=UPI001D11C0D2|nr:hypothetical protein [Sphingobacterium sp. FBM7-1]MCC2598051.1 hypothetical protein [Sphingobacterium sp. FBM7-1]
MEAATEIQAAQTILEEGVRLDIPAPFFLRLFRIKTIPLVLHDPTASVCLRITKLRLQMGVTDVDFEQMSVEDGLKYRVNHGFTVGRILAIGILRGRKRNWLAGKWLAKQLLKHYPFSVLLNIMHIITLGGLEDFMNTIGLLEGMRLTKPNDPSQRKSQRS